MRALWLAALVAAGSIAAVAGYFAMPRSGAGEQLALGGRLYADHCASCHGAELQGQPRWQVRLPNGRLPAPPHDATGHTWHHADSELFLITKQGLAALVPGYESDMPAFEGVLTDPEIEAVLAFIKSGWPERERAYQRRRTLAVGE